MLDWPDVVMADMLLTWVGVVDISRLDVACCSRDRRENFLNLLRSDHFIVPKMIHGSVQDINCYYKWHTLRGIRFRKFVMFDSASQIRVDESVLKDLFTVVGGNWITAIALRGQFHLAQLTLQVIAEYCNAIEEVSVSNCGNMSGLYQVLKSCDRTVSSISLDCCQLKSQVPLSDFSLPNLKRLSLGSEGYFELIAPYCRQAQLTHVCVRNDAIDETGLHTLSKHAASLRELVIANCYMVADNGLVELAAACG